VKPRTGSKRGPNAKMIKYLAVPLPNPSTVLGALGVRQLRVKACFKQITKNQLMFFHELPWTNIADRARLSRLFVVWKRFRIPLSPPSSSEIRQIRAKSQIAIRLCYSASHVRKMCQMASAEKFLVPRAEVPGPQSAHRMR
jgi:hypothetical protein